jgi:hypothetical protein
VKKTPYYLSCICNAFLLISCTTFSPDIDKYDIKKVITPGENGAQDIITFKGTARFDARTDNLGPYKDDVDELAENINLMMDRFNQYAKDYENILVLDRTLDFLISIGLIAVNTTGAVFNYNENTTVAQAWFGIGNIVGSGVLASQTLLKATYYANRKKQLERKLVTLSEAITKARTDYKEILITSSDSDLAIITGKKQQIRRIISELARTLITDIQPTLGGSQ